MSVPGAAASAARSFANRAVHVKVFPRTCNIQESREVLRVLKQFGPVVSFRNLNQLRDSSRNTVLAIYDNPQSASNLVKASPLNFNFHHHGAHGLLSRPENFGQVHVTGENEATSDDSRNETRGDSGKSTSAIAVPSTEYLGREFHLTADTSLMDHQGHIQRQPYYWGFTSSGKSFAEEDLAKSVPLKGMSSISTNAPEIPLRVVRKKAEETGSRKTPRQLWAQTNG